MNALKAFKVTRNKGYGIGTFDWESFKESLSRALYMIPHDVSYRKYFDIRLVFPAESVVLMRVDASV